MNLNEVQTSFKLLLYRGKIPFSLIHRPLRFKCLNEMIIQILTDWIRATDLGGMWGEIIDKPVTFIIPNQAGRIPEQYEIPQIIVPVGNIRVITSFLREDKFIDAIVITSLNFFGENNRSPITPYLEELHPKPIIEGNGITLLSEFSQDSAERWSQKTKAFQKIKDNVGIKISTTEFQGIPAINTTFSTGEPMKIFSGNPFIAARALAQFLNEEYEKSKNENS